MTGIAAVAATITIDVDPMIDLGPLTLAWHGVMTAAGIAAGAWLALRYARERGLSPDDLLTLVAVAVAAGIVGARVLFLVEDGALARPGEWLGTRGFSIYGGVLGAVAAAMVAIRLRGLSPRHLDALAAGFPLGLAVGRVGDVINGEHFGPPSELPWAIRYTHPDAEVPSALVAYHPGGLYEVVLGLLLLAILWPRRHRFSGATTLAWATIGLYGAGRFVMFFYRSDSRELALGLNGAQWISIALVLLAAAALVAVDRARVRR